MALEYVVTKRVFGFDQSKTEKYVARSVGSGQVRFDKMCAKVSRLCGVHRKVVDLVVSGLVDMMAEDIDDGKTVQWENSDCSGLPLKQKAPTQPRRSMQAISFPSASCLRRERFSTVRWRK